MTIEMIGRRTILVSLGDDDMRRYSLRLQDSAEKAQTGLKDVLSRVGEICGLDHRGKSYLVEALPSRDGCLLIISVRSVKRRRVYRVKRRKARELCVFFHADAMLDYRRSVQPAGGYAVYRYEGHYVLLPSASAPSAMTERLSEYGEIYPVSETVFARIREHGKLLMQNTTRLPLGKETP